jgi:hypothetical protein
MSLGEFGFTIRSRQHDGKAYSNLVFRIHRDTPGIVQPRMLCLVPLDIQEKEPVGGNDPSSLGLSSLEGLDRAV